MLKNKILLLTLNGLTLQQIYEELKKDPELNYISEEEAEEVANSIGSKFVTIIEPEYPKKLRCKNNPPAVIYYIGNIDLLSDDILCITGSKFATFYGLMVTEDIIKENDSTTIISGISYGVDKQVVISTLEHNKKFIGVLASSFLNTYPSNLKDLCEVIMHRGGLVISTSSPGSKVTEKSFICKNELMVLLCDRVLIIEAKEQSESMHIANYAIDQNKEVMAIPGSVYNENSKGTNMLIQEGATVYNLK